MSEEYRSLYRSFEFGPKGARFLVKAVEHYIAELEHFRDHVDDENKFWFDNDIALYRSILGVLTTEDNQWQSKNRRSNPSRP